MSNNSTAVLDFGSGKIIGFVAELAGNGNAVVLKARSENVYSGFYESGWVDSQNTKEAIIKTLKQLENQYGASIDKLYIGVPGEFSVVALRETEVKFNSPHKISGRDIQGAFDSADNFTAIADYRSMSVSSTYFVLDGGKSVTDPLGMTATRMFATVSFIFANKIFCSAVESAVKRFGIAKFEFISSCLAQSLYLVSQKERDDSLAVLIDIGYVTTSVSIVLGDGLLYSKSFSVGSGHISDDLSQVLEMDFDAADDLRKKINLNLEFSDNDTYTASGYSGNINAVKANEIVEARIEDIAEKIKICFNECGFEITQEAPVYLSGGGLSYLKGGVNCLSKYLEKKVVLAPVVSPEFDKYDYNSGYGLLSVALKKNKRSRGFFAKLLEFIGG